MPKAIVIYESMFGNTKRAAETIIEGMKEAGVSATLSTPKELDENKLTDFDAIIIGSPNHMGGATRGIKKFIDRLGKLKPEGKSVTVFDTYAGREYEKAVKKMENQLSEKSPGLKLISPGLSIMVEGVRGPIAEGELPKCKEFGVIIANQLKG
jgi:anaerobic nitric oxide reductase flavorubredoxin